MRILVALLVLSLTVQAQPHHEDYERTRQTEAVLKALGQQVLDESALGLEALLQGGAVKATTHARAAKDAGDRLGALEGYAFLDPNFPTLLLELGPAAQTTGHAANTIVLGGIALDYRLVSIGQAVLYHQDMMIALDSLPPALDTYDRLGYDTAELRRVLALVLQEYTDYEFAPPGSGGKGGRTLSDAQVRQAFGAGGPGRNGTDSGFGAGAGIITVDLGTGAGDEFGDESEQLNLVVEPERPYFGQTITLALFDSKNGGGSLTFSGFGKTTTVPINQQGIATATLVVPWDAALGFNLLRAEWERGAFPIGVIVTKVPTAFQNGIIKPPEARIFLLDVEDRPVRGTVGWTANNGTAEIASGNLNTTAAGLVNARIPGQALGGSFVYDGNQTHAGTTFKWGKQPNAEFNPFTGQAEQRDPDLFRQILVVRNEAGGAQALAIPPDNTRLANFFLYAMVALAALELILTLRTPTRYQAPKPQPTEETPLMERRSDPIINALHPLLEILRRQGIPAESLTLSEASRHWQHLGAPVEPWLSNYERTIYTQGRRVAVPKDLLSWLRKRL